MSITLSLKELLKEPEEIDKMGIPQGIVPDLVLRLLFNEGNVSLSRLCEVLKLPSMVADTLLLWMQKEHIVEVYKADSSGLGRLSYVYTLTQAGKERARDSMERSQYIGPAPIPVEMYEQAILLQTNKSYKVTPQQVQSALSQLVLPADFHRRIGPAVNAASGLFLYGSSGNGKTTIAEAIGKLIAGTDPIWLPYTLAVGGQIIQIVDPLIHHPPYPPQEGGDGGVGIQAKRTKELGRVDQRWGLFERPTVTVGGELKMADLELRYNPIGKFYEAPLQLKANGGMFLIDDFGRQQIKPQDLLNRWVVPLESRVDFLRLQTGQTIVAPFRELIIFCTNLNPNDLVDDAFLRRIHIKVEVSRPDDKMFYQIFVDTCKRMNIELDKSVFAYLLQNWYIKTGRKMQGVHPRDILTTLITLCEYEGIPPRLTPQLIDEACRSYFVQVTPPFYV